MTLPTEVAIALLEAGAGKRGDIVTAAGNLPSIAAPNLSTMTVGTAGGSTAITFTPRRRSVLWA